MNKWSILIEKKVFKIIILMTKTAPCIPEVHLQPTEVPEL